VGEAGRELAAAFDIPLLATVPFDPRAASLADTGGVEALLSETVAGEALRDLASAVADRLAPESEEAP
jgi:Flp pilus assembly CpaE family ATPase